MIFNRDYSPKILVIDDDLDTLDLIRLVLNRGGYEVTTASSWEEVMDRIDLALNNHQTYDLIILDIMMPERSGFDIYRSLEVIMGKMPPVIFLSAKYSIDDMVKASELGAAKYLVKPTTRDKLLETVRMVIDQSSQS